MATDTLGNIILRLLVDNKEFAEGLKNALQLVSLSSRQMKDLMEFKLQAPDFSALDLAVEVNQKSLRELISVTEEDVDATRRQGTEKDRAAGSFTNLSDAGQKAFFSIQGGLSVIRLFRSTLGEMIAKANESVISENKLTFATRELEEATPGVTQRLYEHAIALREKTGFEKDSIITAQANLVTTFKEEEAVKRLTPLLLDVAAFKRSQGEVNVDLTSITQALTRAVNGEAGSLSRLGIFLDESVVKSGDVNRIVAELEKQFGGYAEQQDENVVAQAVFNDRLNETKEAIGGLLANALTPVLAPMGSLLKHFTDLPGPIQSATVAAAGFGAVMLFVNTSMGGLPLLIGGIITAGVGLFGFFDSLSGKTEQSAEDVERAKKELEEFHKVVKSLSDAEIEIQVEETEREIATLDKKLTELKAKMQVGGHGRGPVIWWYSDEQEAEFDKLNKRLEDAKTSVNALRNEQKSRTFTVAPQEATTISEITVAIETLSKKREKASESELTSINREIVALQLKKKTLEELGTDAGAGEQISVLEKRLQIGEITRDQFEQQVRAMRAVVTEERTRIDLDLRLRQSAEQRVSESIKELDLKRKTGQITNEVYVTELRALAQTVTSSEKKLEVQQKIAGVIAEQVKQEEEAEARRNVIIITGITHRFEKQRAQVNETLRLELQKQDAILKSETSTAAQRLLAEETIREVRKATITQLAEIDRQEAEETTRKRIEMTERELKLRVLLSNSQLETEILQIAAKYDEAERLARQVYTTESELTNALAQLRMNKDREVAQAQLNGIQRNLGTAQSLISNISRIANFGLGSAGEGFVNDLQRALEKARAIVAVIQTIQAIGSFFSFLPIGGGAGSPIGPFGGSAAGGGSFVTTGPTTLLVGDNPGGRELIEVTPLSGKGETKVSSTADLIRLAGGGKILSFADTHPDIYDYIKSGGAPGSIMLPQQVINLINHSTAGVTRDDLNVVVDELRRLNQKVDANTRETRDLADRININLPDEIRLRADGRDLYGIVKREQRDDERSTQ